jgi:hypothetical protein
MAAVRDYREKTARKSDLERTNWPRTRRRLDRRFAINPVNGERIPSGSPITCCSATARARSWRCLRTMSAIGIRPKYRAADSRGRQPHADAWPGGGSSRAAWSRSNAFVGEGFAIH